MTHKVEDILARYRPVEAPDDLLRRVEVAGLRNAHKRRVSLAEALSNAAMFLLSLILHGVVTATGAIVLLLIAAKGY